MAASGGGDWARGGYVTLEDGGPCRHLRMARGPGMWWGGGEMPARPLGKMIVVNVVEPPETIESWNNVIKSIIQ